MPIVYPITLPATPCPSEAEFIELNKAGLTVSEFTFNEQVQVHGAQKWAFRLRYPAMKKDEMRDWSATMSSLFGVEGTFLFGEGNLKPRRGTWAGVVRVNGTGQTGRTLALKGFAPGATVRTDDRFQISAGAFSRYHKVLADGVADASGLLTVDVWPQHRAPPGDNDPVSATAPLGVFRLASNDLRSTWTRLVRDLTLDIEEAVR
jgi:hypothetical protein